MKPPRRQSMKEVPRKLVTVLAEVAFPKCITPVKYVTKLNAIPKVINLSHVSTPAPQERTKGEIFNRRTP